MEDIKLKKLLNIIGLLIIILLIVTFIIGLVKINEVGKMTLAKQNEIAESYKYKGETIAEDVVVPSKATVFFAEYNGKYSAIDIYTNLSTLLKYKIPKYYEMCKSNNIKDVYQDNESDIKYWFGYVDSNNFEKFISGIQKNFKYNQIELDTYSFEEEKTSFDGTSTKSNLIIKYKNKENNNEVKELKINIEIYEKIDGRLMRVNIIE